MAIVLDNQNNRILVNGVEVAYADGVSSGAVQVTPYNTITATNLQNALEQLADQSFRTDSTPTGVTVESGDIWYDTVSENFYVYREVAPGTKEWVPIMVGTASSDSDTIDAGAF